MLSNNNLIYFKKASAEMKYLCFGGKCVILLKLYNTYVSYVCIFLFVIDFSDNKLRTKYYTRQKILLFLISTYIGLRHAKYIFNALAGPRGWGGGVGWGVTWGSEGGGRLGLIIVVRVCEPVFQNPFIYLAFEKNGPFIYLIIQNADLFIYCLLIFLFYVPIYCWQ